MLGSSNNNASHHLTNKEGQTALMPHQQPQNHHHHHHHQSSLSTATAATNASASSSSDPATLIYTAYAKVYSMTISTSPRAWVPVTQREVPISFYFDKKRSVYRILSYDQTKLVINSTIVPTMTFVKPSTAFGLWTDTKLRTIFGLGFSSKAEMDATSENFEKVVKAAADLERMKSNTTTTTQLPVENNKGLKSNPSVQREPSMDASSISVHTVNIEAPVQLLQDFQLPQSNTSNHVPPPPPYGGQSQASNLQSHHSNLQSHPANSIQIKSQDHVSSSHRQMHVPTELPPQDPQTDKVTIAVGKAIREQSVRTMEYEEERERKVVLLEEQLNELKNMFNTTHDSLLGRINDSEKLVHDLHQVRNELKNQQGRAERYETFYKEERDKTGNLEKELTEMKSLLAEQTTTIHRLTESSQRMDQEAHMLRNILKSSATEVENDMDNLNQTTKELARKIEDIQEITEKVKRKTSTLYEGGGSSGQGMGNL